MTSEPKGFHNQYFIVNSVTMCKNYYTLNNNERINHTNLVKG